ncbi:hypothetical protein [Sinomonas mesophila]|uniref:hypothetical protein n=1 Tax=Sinomonas mesophila TaxID=1531955 RepID=UPI001FE7891B|nr:hypothetical protein [Sinomonas mesophila]
MARRTTTARTAAAIALALALAACAPSPGPDQSLSPSPSAAPTTGAPAPTMPPGGTPSSAAPLPPTTAPTAAQLPEQVAPLTIFYIAMDDDGASGPRIGCGDSVVATFTAPERFRDQVGPTLRRLFADHRALVGQSGLYNALYQSELKYVAGSYDGSTITVWLTGTFMLAGTCDVPRAKAQIEYSAMAAAGAERAVVYVNGVPLDDVLSLA